MSLQSTSDVAEQLPMVTLVRDPEVIEELVISLRRRLTVSESEVPELVTRALDELGPVRVTTYVPILVERQIRDRFAMEGRQLVRS